jgi:hypothetical protein
MFSVMRGWRIWLRLIRGGREGFNTGLTLVILSIVLIFGIQFFSVQVNVSFFFIPIVIGVLGMARALLPGVPFGEDGLFGHPRARMAQPYVAPPNEMPLGRCWMCGGKVKHGNVICLHCGAAQPPTAPGESETSRLSGYDPNAGELVTFLPSDGPESASPYPSAPYPAVNPGGYPTRERAGQWNARMPPPAPAPGSVWRPEPESDGDWDDAPAKRPRWRLR